MKVPIRICRHCHKPVKLQATVCVHCGKRLMDPRRFLVGMGIMAALLIGAYAYLVYAVLVYQDAKGAACEHDFYTRAQVPESWTCATVCEQSCSDKGAGGGRGLLLSTGYLAETTSVSLSCQCTCDACIS